MSHVVKNIVREICGNAHAFVEKNRRMRWRQDYSKYQMNFYVCVCVCLASRREKQCERR